MRRAVSLLGVRIDRGTGTPLVNQVAASHGRWNAGSISERTTVGVREVVVRFGAVCVSEFGVLGGLTLEVRLGWVILGVLKVQLPADGSVLFLLVRGDAGQIATLAVLVRRAVLSTWSTAVLSSRRLAGELSLSMIVGRNVSTIRRGEVIVLMRVLTGLHGRERGSLLMLTGSSNMALDC
jgi:hypothetical protein